MSKYIQVTVSDRVRPIGGYSTRLPTVQVVVTWTSHWSLRSEGLKWSMGKWIQSNEPWTYGKNGKTGIPLGDAQWLRQ